MIICSSLMLSMGMVGCNDDLPSDPNKAILGKWMDLGTSVSPYTSRGDYMEFYKHGRMSVKRKDGVVIDYTYYIRETLSKIKQQPLISCISKINMVLWRMTTPWSSRENG